MAAGPGAPTVRCRRGRSGGHGVLDEDARLGLGDLAGAQVAGTAPALSGVMQPSMPSATGGHEHAGLLADVQQRAAPSASTVLPVELNVTSPPSPSPATTTPAEAFGVQAFLYAVLGPVLFGGVEQARGPAGPGLALGPVGHEFVETGDVEHAVRVGVHLGEPQLSCPLRGSAVRCGRSRLAAVAAQWTMTTSSNSMSRSMPITGVMPLPAVR